MPNSQPYTKAKTFFEKEFSPERKKVIEGFKMLNFEIQQEEKNHRIGSSVYSKVGLIGVTLIMLGVIGTPITAGISSSLSAFGFACGGASGGAAVLHDKIKKGIQRNKIDSLRSSLRNHEKTCKDMNQQLFAMVNSMEKKEKEHFYNAGPDKEMNFILKQFETILEHSDTMKKFKAKNGDIYVLMSVQELLKDLPFEQPRDKDKFTAVTFVIDLKSLLEDPKSMADLQKSGKTKEEWLIENVLQRYQEEYDDIKKVFKSPDFD